MATLSIKLIIFKSKIYILPHKIGLATFSMLLKITQTVAGLLKKTLLQLVKPYQFYRLDY